MIGDSAGIRNNEYARMRLQGLAVGAGELCRDGVPYGLPYRGGGHLLMPGVVEHIYESPDLVRRGDAFHDEEYTPTNAAARPGVHRQPQQQQQQHQPVAQSPHHGYWPLPETSYPEPTSPGAQCCGSATKNGVKAKSTGNYSL